MKPAAQPVRPSPRFAPAAPAIVALLAILSYLPVVRSPFIEDDYPLIAQSVAYGTDAGWLAGFRNPVNRPRLASLFLLDTIHEFAGMNAGPYYMTSIALHVLNSLLVLALGVWTLIGWRAAFFAAMFFAVYEGHNEAVMWISAGNELLLFLFFAVALVCWIRFLENAPLRVLWYSLAMVSYCLALLSKESAVPMVALLAIPLLWRRTRQGLLMFTPFPLLAIFWAASIFATRTYSGHFHDGSFSLSSPFFRTWLNSLLRLFWLWGFLALVALAVVRRGLPSSARIGLLWAALALVPYIFLTYNTRVPSRHTYLASAGLALVIGAAFSTLSESMATRAWVTAAVIAFILQNGGWLWTRKRSQFLERAAPTEQLLEVARRASGPIHVRCFPRSPIIAEQAVVLMTGRPAATLIWSEAEASARQASATFCYPER